MSGWTVPGYTETGDLGSGATGRVAAAVHDESGTKVAIKYLSPQLRADAQFVDRFRAEAMLLSELQHPNVVRFYQYVETDADCALVMELVDGLTLRAVLKESGPMPPEAALSVMRGSLLGLGAAHGLGIVHRDYKPSNVLLDAAGASKLADFGIADRAGDQVEAIGTPSYMAPEQWDGAPAQPVTDIYAVTATFFECLTGKVPYSAETVFELQALHQTAPIPLAEVPAEVQSLVAHGLAKDAAARPPDVAAFVTELEQAAVAAYGVEWEERGRRQIVIAVWPFFGKAGGAGSATLASGAGSSGTAAVPGAAAAGATGVTVGGTVGSALVGAGKFTAKVKAGLAASAIAVAGITGAALTLTSGSGDHGAPVAQPSALSITTGDSDSSNPSGADFPSTPGGTSSTSATPSATPTGSTGKPTTPTSGKSPTSPSSSSLVPPGGTSGFSSISSMPTSSLSSSTPSPTSATPTTPTPTTPTPTPTPWYLRVSLRAINGSYTGTCPPPSTATTFEVDFYLSGKPPNNSVPVDIHWRLNNNGDSGANPDVSATLSAGFTSFQHNEAEYLPNQTVNDQVHVYWSVPGGPSGTTNWVPFTITCTS